MYKENDNPNREAIERYKGMSTAELERLIQEKEKAIKEKLM